MIHVVGAVIVNQKNEILCAQRSKEMAMPEMWEFPGGKVEVGEETRSALVREIQEELGCEITVEDFICKTIHHYPKVTIELDTYFARITGGVLQAREHQRILFLTPDHLLSLEWAPADIPTVQKLIQYISASPNKIRGEQAR